MHRVAAAMANGFFSGAQGTEAFRGWRTRLAPSSCSAQSQDGVFGVLASPWEPWPCQEHNAALLFPILVLVDSGVPTSSTHRSDAGKGEHPPQSHLLLLGAPPVIHRESACPHRPDPRGGTSGASAAQPNKSPPPSRCQQPVHCKFQVGTAGQGSSASFASTYLHLH